MTHRRKFVFSFRCNIYVKVFYKTVSAMRRFCNDLHLIMKITYVLLCEESATDETDPTRCISIAMRSVTDVCEKTQEIFVLSEIGASSRFGIVISGSYGLIKARQIAKEDARDCGDSRRLVGRVTLRNVRRPGKMHPPIPTAGISHLVRARHSPDGSFFFFFFFAQPLRAGKIHRSQLR